MVVKYDRNVVYQSLSYFGHNLAFHRCKKSDIISPLWWYRLCYVVLLEPMFFFLQLAEMTCRTDMFFWHAERRGVQDEPHWWEMWVLPKVVPKQVFYDFWQYFHQFLIEITRVKLLMESYYLVHSFCFLVKLWPLLVLSSSFHLVLCLFKACMSFAH